MTFDAKRLYELLPSEHRVRDADLGYPLRELIGIIADQVAVSEENLQQLYDNAFAETAAPWALPYLGDLLGIRGLSGDSNLSRAPRAEIGHTVAYRRRKGTAAMLELLARDVTGWPARAVEFFERLSTTQHLNHVRPGSASFLSLRPADAIEDFGTPFERGTRTVEVRRIEPGFGKWNIPNVGIFLWRLRAFSLTESPLITAGPADGRHFVFHPLGLDAPLFSQPETEAEITQLAEPVNVPMAIGRRRLKGDPYAPNGANTQFHPSSAYYRQGGSILLSRETDAGLQLIDASEILVADLSDVKDGGGTVMGWAHEAFGQAEAKILLDPVLGRAVFPQAPTKRVFATTHYGFSMNLGGGEYNRAQSRATRVAAPVATVSVSNIGPAAETTIKAALLSIAADGGAVEMMDSSRYAESLPAIDVTAVGSKPRQVEIRAADQRRPTVLLGAPLQINGDADGIVTLDGLFISGNTINVTGALGRLRLRHCTLIPKMIRDALGQPTFDGAPAITITSRNTVVDIEHCLIGPIQAASDVTVHIANSIVDAGAETAIALGNPAGAGADTWRIVNSTIRGKVDVGIIDLASNSIFYGAKKAVDPKAALVVKRRQQGCVRFCWLPAGSLVPRRHACLPTAGGPDVRPSFSSFTIGDPAYAQLGPHCSDAIMRGADDESELGAFHDLFQPQRLGHLRARLSEYLRLGLEAGVFTVT